TSLVDYHQQLYRYTIDNYNFLFNQTIGQGNNSKTKDISKAMELFNREVTIAIRILPKHPKFPTEPNPKSYEWIPENSLDPYPQIEATTARQDIRSSGYQNQSKSIQDIIQNLSESCLRYHI